MKTRQKTSILFFPVIISMLIFTGCSGMLDIPARLPLLNNMAMLFGAFPQAPGVRVASASGSYFISENRGTLDLSVVLISRPSVDVTFTTTSNDLTEASLSTASLTFTTSNWDTPQTIRVTGEDDYVVDGNQEIQLVFGSVVSIDTQYNGLAIPSVPITVLDDETYSIVVSPLTLQTTEAAGTSHTATFYVALSTQPLFNVVVPTITSMNVAEGTVDKSTLTFTPANWNTPQAVTVTAVDDAIEDGNKTYNIVLAASDSTDPGYLGLSLGPVSVTNLDANASIIVTPLSMDLVEGGDNADWGNSQGTFSVVLASAPSGNVDIAVTSGDPARATVNKSSLTFTTGNFNTPQVVTVTAVDNLVPDPDVPVIIDLGTAAGGGYTGKEPSDVRVNIEDNDGAGIRVSRMNRETREAALQNATFQVRLNKQPAAGTTVTIPINDTYDIKNYQHHEGFVDKTTLTFNDTNWNVLQTVTVTPVKDYEMDGDVQYIIELKPATSADLSYNGKKPRNVTINNFNEDTAGIVVTANSSTTNMGVSNQTFNGFATDDMGNLGYQYANFDISLRSKPLYNVTINLAVSTAATTSDGTLNVSSLTFTPSTWNVPQTVRVTGASDGSNEGNITYDVTTAISTSDLIYGNAAYVGKPTFTIYSCDNDVNNDIVNCIKSGQNMTNTTEGGGTASFWLITKNSCSSGTVGLSSNDPGEGSVPASITIDSSNWNLLSNGASNRVVVTGVDDTILDGTQPFTVSTNTSSGCVVFDPANFSMWNADNEQKWITAVTGNTTETGSTTTVNLRLGSQPTGDVTVSVACVDSTECKSVNPTTLTFSNGNYGTNQPVTVTGEDDTISDGNVTSNILFTVTASDDGTGVYVIGNTTTRGVTNVDDELPGKAIWVTNGTFNGELAGTNGTTVADSYCNGSDTNKPTGLGAATYKALMVDGVATAGGRVATTTGTNATGQNGWVLQPGYHYYLRTGASGDDATTRLFIANSFGLIPFNMDRPFNTVGTDNFWTGMSTDMQTASTTYDNCAKWSLANDPVTPTTHYDAAYGTGNVITSASISAATNGDCTTLKKIICVQQ